MNIDEEKNIVELVPLQPTTGTVTLHGAQGYNNGVKLLNDACNRLYSNSTKGITARSINIEDIEKTLEQTETGRTALQTAKGSTYKTQVSNEYTTRNYYPSLYKHENLSVIDGNQNIFGFGLSEQNNLIGRTSEGSTNGQIKATTSIQPYRTEYVINNLSSFNTICIARYDSYSYAIYYARSINDGNLYLSAIDTSLDVTYDANNSLFPILNLTKDNLQKVSSGTYNVK